MPAKTAPAAPARSNPRLPFALGLIAVTEAGVDRSLDAAGKEKRQVVVTALQEGPGNLRDRRWYKRECVEGLRPLVEAKRKIFFNHTREGAAQDVRDWCATVTDAWVAEEGSACALKVRLQVHDDFLWARCKEAPGEIALSIEGVGDGPGVQEIEGRGKYHVIERIAALAAFKVVSYPGNARMGADVVEGQAAPADPNLQEETMDLKALTIQLLKESRPDLIEALLAEAAAAVKAEAAKDKTALAESFKAEMGELKKATTAIVEDLKGRLEVAERKADAYEVRNRMAEKGRLIEGLLDASGLPKEAMTPLFRARLNSLSEREATVDGKAVKVSVEEQVKAEIEEQRKLITGEYAQVKESGAGGTAPKADGVLSEEEQGVVFNNRFFGGPSLEKHRADKKAALAAAKA